MFECTDNINDMEQSLIDDGLIGISGGRVSVRRVLRELTTQLNDEKSEEGYISLTYNHPDTEPGYIWSSIRYSPSKAKSIVQNTYAQKKRITKQCY